MIQDQLVSATQSPDGSTWEIDVLRQGRTLHLSFEKEAGNYYPMLELEESAYTSLRANWMH
jgi:hypothetical protein